MNCKRQQRARHNTTNSVAHFTEDDKTETISPTAATKITTRQSHLMYVCPCIIYEIEERYPLDATIYLLL